ncbi:hypothetical protein [Brachyspira hampsonii]|uniref:hypothetical protein n=1 Tax=Brachyspira hampsonii TaxID=1287055 RepID=UPI0020106437|nr:hypothetical protein [Brachyspira hampsonii]
MTEKYKIYLTKQKQMIILFVINTMIQFILLIFQIGYFIKDYGMNRLLRLEDYTDIMKQMKLQEEVMINFLIMMKLMKLN